MTVIRSVKKISVSTTAMTLLIITSLSLSTTLQQVYPASPAFGSIINVNDQKFGSMAASGDNMYLLWSKSKIQSDGGVIGTDVLFRKIKDDGSLLGSVINLRSVDASAGNRMISNIDLAVYEKNVYVTWLEADIPSDNYAPKFDIFIRVSNDSGATFSNAVNLSNNGSVQSNYKILAYGNNVYLTWIDSSLGNDEVFFRSSNDNGATWNPVINLSHNAGMSSIQGSSITVSGSNVFVVWQDNSSGKLDILFRASTDNELPLVL